MKSLTLILSLGLLFLSQLALSQDKEIIKSKNIQELQNLIDQGVIDANSQNDKGQTLLHIAIADGQTRSAELLMNENNVNIKDNVGETPLHIAAHVGNARLIKLLLKYKANINAKSLDGFTPFHISIFQKRVKIMKLLAENGAEINAQTADGWTPLDIANHYKQPEAINLLREYKALTGKKLLKSKNLKDVSSTDRTKNKFLIKAIKANDLKEIQNLIDKEIDLNTKDINGETALHVAAYLGYEKATRLLAVNGANPNIQDNKGHTSLDRAISSGNTKFEKLLKELGALTSEELAGEAFRKEAIKGKNIDELQNLIDQGVIDTDAQNDKGQILLHVAIADGQTRSAELLMNENNVNAQDDKGETPLHAAVYINNIFLIKPLLKYKADINIKSLDGSTPVHIAAIRGRVKAMKLLAENKADINAQNKKGQTALDLAVLHDHPDVAELLKKLGALTSEELLKTANLKGVSTKSKTAKTKAAKTKAKTKTKKSTKNQSSCKGIFKA